MTVARLGVRIKATEIAGYVTLPDSPVTLDEARRMIDLSMLESAWQTQATAVADLGGWAWWHDNDSRESEPSWPDLTLWRDRLVFFELKREKGKLSVDRYVRDRRTGKMHFRKGQATTILELLEAGQEIYIARPRDFEAVIRILARGGGPDADLRERTRVEALAAFERGKGLRRGVARRG